MINNIPSIYPPASGAVKKDGEQYSIWLKSYKILRRVTLVEFKRGECDIKEGCGECIL